MFKLFEKEVKIFLYLFFIFMNNVVIEKKKSTKWVFLNMMNQKMINNLKKKYLVKVYQYILQTLIYSLLK